MDKKIVKQIWEEVSEKVKDEVVLPSVFTAIEHAVPIDIQEKTFILGFAAQDTPLIGYLTGASIKPIIIKCLSDNMKTPMEIMVVEGTSLEEYLAHEELLKKAQKTIDTAQNERNARRKIENDWETVGDKCIRSFSAMENKGYAINKAVYLKQVFKIINEKCQEINYVYNENPVLDRCISRVFDRIETAVELPAGIIAYLFLQAKEHNDIN